MKSLKSIFILIRSNSYTSTSNNQIKYYVDVYLQLSFNLFQTLLLLKSIQIEICRNSFVTNFNNHSESKMYLQRLRQSSLLLYVIRAIVTVTGSL